MNAIIFIGCNGFGTSNEALSIAKEMGYFVVLFTDREKFMKKKHKSQDVDSVIFMKNLLNEKKVIAEITKLRDKDIQICACISFIDPFVSFAARLAKHLGLTELSVDSLCIMENKILVREKLKDLSVTPFYAVFNFDLPIEQFVKKNKNNIPLVLKSPSSNGSKNVLLIDSSKKFEHGIEFLQNKYPLQSVLVEQYLIGPQYLIEMIVYNNEIKVIGVIEQEIINNGRFIVIGYKYPAMLTSNEHKSLLESIETIVHKLELSNGSCHLEMRKVQDEWKLIEINPRMSGGAMNRIIEEGTGISLVKEIIKMHLGEEPTLNKTYMKHVYARYLTINTRGKLLKVVGKERALEHTGVKYVYVKPSIGSILTSPFSMGYRYACIIAAAETPELAQESALKAAKEIKFYLEPL
ncbi:hypothetical protein J6TS2_03570 [Heyndrickxia sporothermodurans]|nr:hypothetical protein J6TS2_03570 [Heyndrickxia sporothermodurans]